MPTEAMVSAPRLSNPVLPGPKKATQARDTQPIETKMAFNMGVSWKKELAEWMIGCPQVKKLAVNICPPYERRVSVYANRLSDTHQPKACILFL